MLLRSAVAFGLIGVLSAPAVAAPDHRLHGVVQISAGELHTCAALQDGTVACWGRNDDGELGNPTVSYNTLYPVLVYSSPGTILSDVVSVSTGGFFTCALRTSGEVFCWGKNAYGSLGNGTIAPSFYATKVSIAEPVLAISTGGFHGCAILSKPEHSVRCWGDNSSGQLGNNSTTYSATPVDVLKVNIFGGADALTGVDEISAGGNHTCALTSGIALCWGYNNSGQLGTGNRANSLIALPVKTTDGKDILTGVTQISAGGSHTCAVFASSATTDCWGSDISGQLGDGRDGTSSTLPVFVAGIGVNSVSSGGDHTLAVLADGRVATWGENYWGQLGDGSTDYSNVPVVLTLTTVKSVSAGHFHSCAALADGTAKCWGYGDWGQIGDGPATTRQLSPADVSDIHFADRIFTDRFE